MCEGVADHRLIEQIYRAPRGAAVRDVVLVNVASKDIEIGVSALIKSVQRLPRKLYDP
jgi:hypothetical protein